MSLVVLRQIKYMIFFKKKHIEEEKKKKKKKENRTGDYVKA